MSFLKYAPLRWGIFGAGKISHEFVSAVKQLPKAEHEILGIASRSTESSTEFKALHALSKSYKSYADLVKDPEVDIVYIGTVNSCHFEQAKLALENGKHVLCEKALCRNAKEAKDLAALARDQKRFLMEGFWTRFFPAFKKMMEEIDSGSIGKVHNMLLPCGVGVSSLERFRSTELGGGCLMNHGVYGVQFITRVLGRPDKIVATGHVSETGVDLDCNYILHYDNGASAVIICTSVLNWTKDSMEVEVYGSKGNVKLIHPFWAPTTVESSISGTTTFPLPDIQQIGVGVNTIGFVYEAEEVARCLKQGLLESPLMPLDESVLIYEICDEIRRQIGVRFPDEIV